MDYLLSRHPIFKSKVDLAGYEIRSRAVGEKSAGTPEAERSMFSMLEEGLDQIVGQHPCFIGLTSEALAEGLWKGIPPDRLVLGYFSDFGPADEVAKELLKLT